MAQRRCVAFSVNGQRLFGVLSEPANAATRSATAAVIVNGGPQYRVGAHRSWLLIADALADAGIATLRFDLRGTGDSEGSVACFTAVEDDLTAADRIVREETGAREVLWLGLCEGAASVLLCAPSSAAGFVLANPWPYAPGEAVQFDHVEHYSQRLKNKRALAQLFLGKVKLGKLLKGLAKAANDAFRLRRAHSPLGLEPIGLALKERRVPALLLLSERDQTAVVFTRTSQQNDTWRQLMRSKHGIQRIDIPEATHTWASASEIEAARKVIVDWVRAFRVSPCPIQ
jgi:uncharacterized protein